MKSSMARIKGEMRHVKNLRWLLRHWKETATFKVSENPDKNWDAFVEVFNRDGVLIYQTGFASRSILRDWLARPVFRGLPLDWFGEKTYCGEKNGKILVDAKTLVNVLRTA